MALEERCFIGDSSRSGNRDSTSPFYATHLKPKFNIWLQ